MDAWMRGGMEAWMHVRVRLCNHATLAPSRTAPCVLPVDGKTKKFNSLGTFDIIGSFLWYETWI